MNIYKKFTYRETELLRKHKCFYEDLNSGKRKPTTKAQDNFVNVCRGVRRASTDHEKVWIRYKKCLVDQKRNPKKIIKQSDSIQTPKAQGKIKAPRKPTKPKKSIIQSIMENTVKQRNKEIGRKIPIPDMKPTGIPDFEEGRAHEDFLSREGAKRMRGQVFADILRRKHDFDS